MGRRVCDFSYVVFGEERGPPESLIAMLRDADSQVREAATRALAWLSDIGPLMGLIQKQDYCAARRSSAARSVMTIWRPSRRSMP